MSKISSSKIELEFLSLEFHHFISHPLFFFSSSSSPPSVFSNQIVFLHSSSKLQIVFLSLCSSSDLQIVFFLCSSLYPVLLLLVLWNSSLRNSSSPWINCSTSTIWTRVFRTWVCHQTRASQTRDASFLNGFKSVLTNKIVSKNYARWQISPPPLLGLETQHL